MLMRADDGIAPAGLRHEHLAHHPIQLLCRLHIQQPLAVGGIAQHHAGLPLRAEGPQVGTLRRHAVADSRFSSIFRYQRQHLRVNIPTPGDKGHLSLKALRPTTLLQPHLVRDTAPVHSGKAPPDPGRNAPSRQRRLNKQRTGATAGIAHQPSPPSPGHIHDRRCQRLLDGSAPRRLAIAPLMQTGAAGIQQHRHLVPQDGKLNLTFGIGLVEKPGGIRLPQPLHRRLFHDGLTVRHTVQLRVKRPSLDRKGVFYADEPFQRQCPDPVKELGEGAGGKPPQQDLDPLGVAGTNIGPSQNGHRTGKQHPPILRAHIVGAQTTQLIP